MRKILVVDDAETQRLFIRKELESIGCFIIEACDGADGLEKLKANSGVNLIICDVNMPKMDGITMCSKVAEIEEFKQIPIFMLTTETSADMKQKAKQYGVRAWIVKPCDGQKLQEAVKKVTGIS